VAPILRKELLDTTRGRIVTLLQRGGLIVDDIAEQLGLSSTAIRGHITAMERDGLVQRAGRRPGTTRPSNVFELTPDIEQLLSRAYIPFLTHLVSVFASGLASTRVDELMREVGRALADELTARSRPAGDLRARAQAVSTMMNEQLGAVTHVESNGKLVIRGSSCPLAAVSGKHPAVCRALESLVSEVVGAPVHECCDRDARPRCCFEIDAAALTTTSGTRRDPPSVDR
jgi:predicted ArsR family transcriptional regulator